MEEDVQELYEKGGVEANITGESSNKTDAFLRDETNQTPKNGKGKDHKESSSEPENSGEDDSHVPKKRRLIWTTEMHQKFLDAIEQIGHDRAFPKKIVEVMNVPGLTRENVASHLQKYRICLKKVQEGMDKYYWGSNTEANCTRVPYTYESLLGTSRLPFSGSSQLASRNFYSMSSSSHSSLYGQGSAIGTSRVRLAPPSYSSFDVSSLSINTGNVPNQYNQMTEVNTNVRGYCDDKRNKLLSILNRRPPSNTPDDHATASSSTSNSAFIGLRIASDGKSLFLGGSDRSEIVSAENYSAKRSDFNLQESALPLLPCSNIENYLQDSSLPPLPGSTVEDHFGESSFPSFPEFQVENSWQQLKSSEKEQISWQQLAKDIEDDLITFNPQQETYGTNETENGHAGTYLEQQNCLQSLPWEILENADLEMIKKILPNNHTVNPLPSLSAQSNPNPNMTSYLLNNNLSNQEDSLPPLPSDIPWSLYPDSNSSNHSAHVLNQQSQLPPIISETGWNETSDVSMPLNNISDHQNLLPSFPSDYFWNLDSDPVHPIIVPPSLPEAYEGAVQQLPSLPDNTVNQVIPQPINTYFSETNIEEGIGDIRNLEEGIGDMRNLEEGIGDMRNLEEGIGDSSPGLLDFIGFHDTLSNE